MRTYQKRQRKPPLIQVLVAASKPALPAPADPESATETALTVTTDKASVSMIDVLFPRRASRRTEQIEQDLSLAVVTLALGMGGMVWWPLEIMNGPVTWLSMRDLIEYASEKLAAAEQPNALMGSCTLISVLLVDPYNVATMVECCYYACERAVQSAQERMIEAVEAAEAYLPAPADPQRAVSAPFTVL